MTENPAVSIVIPTHNRRQLLAQAVDSVRTQSFRRWECIVVDDASSDDTQEYLKAQPDIRGYRFNQSRERTRARNFGLDKAKGEFVLFLDDDDLLPESAIESHYNALRPRTDVFGSVGGAEIFWPDGRREPIYVSKKEMVRDVMHELLFGWTPVSGQWLFRKSLFREFGGWNEEMFFAEDHELLLRMALHRPALVIPGVVHYYRVHDQWRPDDFSNIMTSVREDIVSRVPVENRRSFQNVLRARALREAAETAYEEARMFEAAKLYGRMLLAAPRIFVSPLTRADLLPPLLKSFLGGWLIKLARRFRIRRLAKSGK